MRISLHFSCKYCLEFDRKYVFVEKHNFLVNLKTSRTLKQITKGGSIGYIINGKFYTLTALRKSIVLIDKKDNYCPF